MVQEKRMLTMEISFYFQHGKGGDNKKARLGFYCECRIPACNNKMVQHSYSEWQLIGGMGGGESIKHSQPE